MGEKPYIQYQEGSILCEEVAICLYKKLEYLYNYSGGTQSKKKKKVIRNQDSMEPQQIQYREPRATLVILDRTFDLITPMMHDYSYESTIFDYLPIPENGSLDNVIKPQRSKTQKQAASESKKQLNEKDAVWEKYKNSHIADVIASLDEEVKEIVQ